MKPRFSLTRRDAAFVAVVGAVLVVLALGSGKRTTPATPDDPPHRNARARATCLGCHGPGGVRPVPKRHSKMDQCFLCHAPPAHWVGRR